MRILSRTLLSISVMLLALAAPGYGADLAAVITTLEGGYNALNDVQADFSQRTAIASVKREERGRGELFIKKVAGGQAMFRFDYTKPRQQIISNGKTVWYYLQDNNQVMVSDARKLFTEGNNIALNYLTGMGHISRDFTISFAKEGRDRKGNYVLDLVPKKPNQVMTRLRFVVAASAVEEFQKSGKPLALFPIVSSEMEDPFGNRTIIEFSRVRINQGMGNDRFAFKIPKGVEVIKNR